MQERSIREEENNKRVSFTKMRSGEREIYSQVRSVGRAFFQRSIFPRSISLKFYIFDLLLLPRYIYIYIYTLAAYLHELGGLDYLKFRGGRLIGA